MMTGVECEYFLITPDGSAISDPADTQSKPCYDQSTLMRRFPVIREICDAMLTLDWGPYQNDHEDANGQFEMNWTYADCLRTADRHVFFKYMVKTLAEKHDLRATFMPKPFIHLTGNGCHTHVSLWDKAGTQNHFFEQDESGFTSLSVSQRHHAPCRKPLCHFNLTVNQLQAHQCTHFGALVSHASCIPPHPYDSGTGPGSF